MSRGKREASVKKAQGEREESMLVPEEERG